MLASELCVCVLASVVVFSSVDAYVCACRY